MNERGQTHERRLDDALAGLPRRKASPGFTGRVMARLGETPRARQAPAARAWILAAAALAAVAVGLFLGSRPEPPLPALAAERESLRLEHDELRRDLESLRLLARETRPVLHLAPADDMNLVLDLSSLAAPPTGARPASLEGGIPEPRYY